MITILAAGGAVTVAILAALAHGFALVFDQRQLVRPIWLIALGIVCGAALLPQELRFAATCRAQLATFARLAMIAAPFLFYAYGVRRLRRRAKAREYQDNSDG